MQVGINGGAGNLGKELVKVFREKGHTVYIGTISRPFVKSTIKKLNLIIDCAALTSVSHCTTHTSDAIQVNFDQRAEFASHCLRINENVKFLNIGTINSYSGGRVTETSPLNPRDFYGITKAAQQMYISLLQKDFNCATYVLPNLVIPGADFMFNKLVEAPLKKKPLTVNTLNYRRTYMHIEDAALAIYAAIEAQGPRLSNLVIGPNESYTGIEVVTKCHGLKYIKQLVTNKPIDTLILSPEKFNTLTSYKFKHNLHSMIVEASTFI